MTRTLRSRTPLAAAVAAVAIPLAAAGAAGAADVQVHGPTHPKVDKNFTVRADGNTGTKRVLQVTIHLRGKCSKTYGDEKDRGQYIAFARFVGPGHFDEQRSKLHFDGKINGHYCAYLGNPDDLTHDPPVARDSKHFQVVNPSSKR
jgi:hypothetical protein